MRTLVHLLLAAVAVPIALTSLAAQRERSDGTDASRTSRHRTITHQQGGGQVLGSRTTQELWRSLNGRAPTVTSAPTQNLNASEVIWAFFAAHARR